MHSKTSRYLPLKQTNMRFITNILQYLKNSVPSKKYLLFGLFLFVGYTFAADVSKEDSDAIEMIVQVLNFLFTVITFLLTPAIILCGWLLSPDWTMGDFFGLRPYFIQVWVLVSNLVYIIFALMLLWMAVMQIFSSESNYAFKKKLPRFLVGIMIVPFTWLIVSWTLSFANQAVAAVLSIPS
jgi:predicted tellurium resistance membrane protein TerC